MTTILTGRPGHCGRPASLLRSVTRLPKVFIGGLEVDLCLLRLRWFEPEIFEGDPTGLQSPQINGEQASTGHDRSFSSSSTSDSVSTKDVRELLKAPPGGFHFFKRQTASLDDRRWRCSDRPFRKVASQREKGGRWTLLRNGSGSPFGRQLD